MKRGNTIKYFALLLLLVANVCVVPSNAAKSSFAGKIKHVVVLMEENRSFDHMFGWFKDEGVDGLTGNEYNSVNTSNPKSDKVYVSANGPFVAPCDPNHGTPATTYKIFGNAEGTGEPTMSGFVQFEDMAGHASTNHCAVMQMQSPSHLPIMASLSENFVLMDRFFCAHPGPTWPNRLYMLSATSAGNTETGTFYQDKDGRLYPQKTIFDQVDSAGLTWRNYFNDTPWELFLETIATHPENLADMEKFYEDARTGNLPSFAWINPRAGANVTLNQGSNDQHPDHDVALGERYYKDIYEALRASPAWNDTLYIITYDEHGGFYDHVPPPLNVPAPDNSTSYPDKGFLFNRLGIRIPTLLISPWLPKGLVLSGPPAAQKPFNNSEYTLTSIMATARILLNMPSTPLTHRDAWSATFEHLFELLDSPRTDCPLHLPPAPPPSNTSIAEEFLPVNDLQKTIMQMHANLAGVEFPSYVTRQGQVSEWLQIHYNKHADYTSFWKRSKTSRHHSLAVLPNKVVSTEWTVNKGSHAPFLTISSTPSSPSSTLCIDHDEKGVVGVTPCYPRANPDANLDYTQRWIWGEDCSIHSFSNSSLCLTKEERDSGCPGMVILRPCVGSKEQQWIFVEGEKESGKMLLGEDESLSIVSASLFHC